MKWTVQLANGEAWIYRGQRYVALGVVPYQKRDGSWTSLRRWATHCADCGASMEITTALTTRGPSRRCNACKRPGVRVAGGKA
jgi:hypothetical protein